MAKIKITETAVESAQTQAKAIQLRDAAVPGFMCRIAPKGRVFVPQYRTDSGQFGKPVITHRFLLRSCG